MDAHCTVGATVSELKGNMDKYAARKGNYVGPYTTLVTSSMMGKSRHMKEVANHLPCVYICLGREAREYRSYPRASPSLVEWSLRGAATILGNFQRVEESDFCFSTLRWFAFIICTIHELATWIDDGRFFMSLDIDDWKAQKLEYVWLWKFFAEPPNLCKLTDFWAKVQKATVSMLKEFPSGEHARSYWPKQSTRPDALKRLRQCFAKHQINDDLQPLIFIFDEARTLCDHDAYTGNRIYEEHAVNFHESKEHPMYMPYETMPFRSFSNFNFSCTSTCVTLSFGGCLQGS
jgi:hypothetical protein